jgi:hypothetical protein
MPVLNRPARRGRGGIAGDAEEVAAALMDYLTASVLEAEKELFKLIENVNRRSNFIGAVDIGELKAVGWLEEAIQDTIGIRALFKFYNRWCDASGMQGMPTLDYQMSGHQLATVGYVRPEEKRVEAGVR